ncbi:MAG TPA: hypothetical protein DEO87_05195 [Lachnospiraceae bacterium]|nr:hypothetical protein [Lachnospiraceae bacterium]
MKKTVSGMRNKISKAICAVMCMGMMLTGCGSSNDSSGGNGLSGRTTSVDLFGGSGVTESGFIDASDNKAESMALSDYIKTHQPCLMYLNEGKDNGENKKESTKVPSKNDCPEGIYYFHDDVVTIYDTKLTWGDIARMSDEEIISGSEAVEYVIDTDYKFVVYTDSTGNNFDGETIAIKEVVKGRRLKDGINVTEAALDENGEPIEGNPITDDDYEDYEEHYIYSGSRVEDYFIGWMTVTYGAAVDVYESKFIGWNGNCPDPDGKPSFWIKKVDDTNISLDKPSSPNVMVDPTKDRKRRIKYEDIFE